MLKTMVCLRIIFSIGILFNISFAREYVFSYRLVTRDGMILNERYYVSPSMLDRTITKYGKDRYCEIPHESKNEVGFIENYKDDILDCLFSWGVKLEDRSKVVNLQNKSTTILSIPATRIYVEYENGISKVYLLLKSKGVS